MRRRLVLVMAILMAACTSARDAPSAADRATAQPVTSPASTTRAEPAESAPPSSPTTDVPTTPPTATTDSPTTTSTPTTTTTTTTTTTATITSTAGLPTTTSASPSLTSAVIGTSVEGRPITVVHRGTPGGPKVLVFGVIHGDEQAGLQIVQLLETMDLPHDIDLWLVETMNPDGFAHDVRQNADQVDLNRNFPYNWGPLGAPGDWEYAGPSAASEPETEAVVQFMTDLQPDLTIWYHQDYNRISPSTGREGRVRARYSELTGIPLLTISGGTYTGTAATWARKTVPTGVAFIVELGTTLDPSDAIVHAKAVLTIAGELS